MGSRIRPLGAAAAAALVTGLAAAPAVAQSSAFALRGTIRDFKSDHPDFAVAPTGHVPANVAMRLDAGAAPDYTAFGFEALEQWRDRLARPIAPHMYNAGRITVEVVSAPTVHHKAIVDSYDSFAGTYDPATAGGAPEFLTGSTMPTLSEPVMSVPFTDTFARLTNSTSTLSDDLWCRVFEVGNQHRLQIDGDITILATEQFILRNRGIIELTPGSRLTVYFKQTGTVYDQCIINAGGDPNLVRFYNLGVEPFTLVNQSEVCGTLVSPDGPLTISDGSDFYGKVTAHSVDMQNVSGLHIDGIPSLCSIQIEDKAGTAGVGDGAITSDQTFGQWFRDAVGVNASRPHTVVMRDSGAGYEHRDDSFYPIDEKLYGNEGQPHNGYFTFDVAATFTYDACSSQVIAFEGDDDCWIFIDNRLVIDLGGVAPGTPQVFEVDRLNLVDGETYSFRLFYAHRNGSAPPRFNLRTTFELMPEPVRAGMSGYPSFD